MKGYLVECRTGCSCCSNENHWRGPFSTREIAEKACRTYTDQAILASQYAQRGRYEIHEYEAEILPDGRIILADAVFSGWKDDAIVIDDQIYLELRS